MSLFLAAAAVAVVAGAVVALSARDARVGVLGLTLAGVVAPVIADPLPDSTALAFRLAAAILAGYLVWVVFRETDSATGSSSLGWPVELVAAASAFVIGLGPSALGIERGGPVEAVAAGLALTALSMTPIIFARDAYRLGAGLVLLLTGAGLLRTGLAGTPGPLEQVTVGLLTVGLLGAIAVLSANAVAVSGSLDLGTRTDDDL